MVPAQSGAVPAPAKPRPAAGDGAVLALVSAVVSALVVLGPGCSWFTVDDRELDAALAEASVSIEEGDAAATIHGLGRLAWNRRESVAARLLLVEACRRVDTIESRRIAERALRELIELDPDNPDYRFDLAEILFARGFDRDARRELDQLLGRVPDHPGAHLALGQHHQALYRRFQLRGDLEQMLGACARAAGLAPESYEANRCLAEAYLLDRQWESASGLLERLRERWPDDGWLAALAATAFARPGTYPEAAATFERAFALMGDRERAPFEDLSALASPYDQRHFEVMVPDERENFLRVFWRSKDPQPVTRVNEREVEHWRRVVMADLKYAVPRFGKRGWDTARGEMLIRYGEPLYAEYIHGGRALLFSVPGWYHVYATAGGELEATFYDMALNGMFYHPFSWLPTPYDLAAYRTPQSYDHDYGGRWITPVMAIGEFRGTGARTRAEVYLALAADSVASYRGTTLGAGTVVFDREWNEVARSEELVDLDQATVAGEGNRALVHQVNLELKPGSYIVASQVEGDAGAVVGTTTREVEVGRFGGGPLAISTPELAFAVAESGPERFSKGDLNVVPNATGDVRGDEPLVLYFEIYNLAPDTGPEPRARYSVHYRITPADREGNSILTRMADAFRTKTFIEASFVEQAPGGVVRRNLSIDVGALAADRYRLDLEVTDLVSGVSARRMLTFRRSS